MMENFRRGGGGGGGGAHGLFRTHYRYHLELKWRSTFEQCGDGVGRAQGCDGAQGYTRRHYLELKQTLSLGLLGLRPIVRLVADGGSAEHLRPLHRATGSRHGLPLPLRRHHCRLCQHTQPRRKTAVPVVSTMVQALWTYNTQRRETAIPMVSTTV